MRNFIVCLLIVVGTSVSAQEFYDMQTIQKIEITFAESNWDQLLDIEYAGSGGYILAESVSINGEVFDSVGVKYKGNSTYNPNQVKNPFHIELDTYKSGHDYDGYTDIKLSNVAKDPSFLREVLSYEILRKYMAAPLSNYANVYVNGTLIGLYSNSESISRKFVNSRFYSKSNTFVKCNPPAGAGPQSNDFPNLVYLGQDSTNYYDAYELKSTAGWDELIDLCDTLANEIDAIENILDVDKALWMLAYNNVLVNLDSYNGAFAQNYYLYRDHHGRFLPVVWDLNESFGRFANTGNGNLNGTTAKQNMSHVLHENDPDFPLIRQLLANDRYKRMYLAHYKTILLENFNNDTYRETGLMLQELIDADVQADNNKFFTYNNFQDNLDSDVGGGGGGPGGGNTPGIVNLMEGRVNYLLGLTDFQNTEPTISEITLSNSDPLIGEEMTITAKLSSLNHASLAYRDQLGAPFTKVEMFDDGNHGDGAANDGIYGASFDIVNSFMQYYIYAENEDIGKFSPVRAEHEFYSFTATTSNPTIGDLVINEFMASNSSAVADQDGEYDDWIELYNNGSTSINLENYNLSDDNADLQKWTFPEGTSIGANSYLIIWADDDEDQEGLHANFKINSTSESLFLLDDDGNIIDEVSFANQNSNISFGRYPNGTGLFQTMEFTFNAENSITTDLRDLENSSLLFQASPNPSSGLFLLEAKETPNEEFHFAIYDLQGKLQQRGNFHDRIIIETAEWNSGMYIIHIENEILKIIVD